MGLKKIGVILVIFVGVVLMENVEIVTPQITPAAETTVVDSYLQALKESQGNNNAANRYDEQIPVEHEDTQPSPPGGYLPTKPSYHQVFQPYGPPTPTYGGPIQTPFYGVPFAAPANAVMSLFAGLMPKGIDLETIFKIILKLTLFKILVKFFAVICLLLAYPLFQSKDKDMMMEEEEDDRQRQLNDLTAFVWDAIDPGNFTQPQLIERIINDIDANMTRPSESAAIKFLEFCVNLANMSISWMTSMVRRRNGTETDPSFFEQLFAITWSKLMSFLFPRT